MSTTLTKTPCMETQVLASQVDPTPCAPDVGRWVLAATILGSSMAFIEGTVVNVALPVLQTELNASALAVQWVVQMYALLMASLILVGGSLGDHFGRRRIFVIGVAIFGLASIGCTLATSISQLIIAQAVKGVGAAMLVPGSLAIISATFSESERGRAIGTWSGATAITTTAGPLLGGWLVENVSWRAVFLVNVPIAIIVILLSLWRVPESRDKGATGALDWGGALLATVSIGAIIYGLTEASRSGFADPFVLGTLAVGLMLFGLFIWLEGVSSSPMMPLTVFRSTTFSGANLLTLLLYSALGGMMYFLPFNLIQVQGYTPLAAGMSLLPFVIIVSVLSRWSGSLVETYGARLPLIGGPLVVATGFALFTLPDVGGSYWTTFFPPIAVLGLGMALSIAPLTTTVMNAIDSQQAGVASGVNNAVSRAAGLIGIATMGIVIFYAFNLSLDSYLAPLDLTPELQQAIDAERINLAAATLPDGLLPEMQLALEQAIKAAYVSSFRVIMLTASGLAIASSLAAWWLIDRR